MHRTIWWLPHHTGPQEIQQSQAQPFSTHAPLWWSTGVTLCSHTLPHCWASVSPLRPGHLGTVHGHVHSGFFPSRWALSRKRNVVSLWAQILYAPGVFLSLSLVLCWAQGKDQARGPGRGLHSSVGGHNVSSPLAPSCPECFLPSGTSEL